MIGAGHHRAAAGLVAQQRRSPADRSRPRPGRRRPPSPGARHARSSARRRCRRAACPGSRVAAMRAGMRMRTSAIASQCAAIAAYTGCKTRGKPAICAPPASAAAEPFSDEFVRNQQDSRRPARDLSGRCSPSISRPARSSPRTAPAKPGYEIAVKEEQPAAARGGRAAADRRSRRCWPALRPSTAPTSPSNAKPATTSRKAPAPRSAPISTVWSAARSPRWPASTIRRALKAKGGNWTSTPSIMADQAARRRPRHRHDLRRPVQREAARRRHRLSEYAVEQSGAAAEGSQQAGMAIWSSPAATGRVPKSHVGPPR